MTGHDEAEEPEQTPGVWEPPPKEECQEPQTYTTVLGELGDILRVRMVHDLRDNLVDFALIFMTGAPGALSEVARADIRHTGLHVHWFYQDGKELRREEISPVATLPEVQAAYNEAFDRVTRNWEEYKRRWHRG